VVDSSIPNTNAETSSVQFADVDGRLWLAQVSELRSKKRSDDGAKAACAQES